MPDTDAELISFALQMRANYIETGNVTLSANDAAERKTRTNSLTDHQKQLVSRLRGLAVTELATRR